ncbi:hypothetical protein P43SY_003962 [Pythium insidiosum]|uniref:Histone deacetylase domain-containing protein n=1 Tax=Pythium insidiosum TaxID=114742 RepID=A0AAD5Q4V8_PYTIN|nr:hypothetical protein P43SY_003962 [Pythium insidiosum]
MADDSDGSVRVGGVSLSPLSGSLSLESRRMLRSILRRQLPPLLGSLQIPYLNAVFNDLTGQTAFFTSSICEEHQVPQHPESHRRAQVIRESVLRDLPMVRVFTDIAPATREQLLLFHSSAHVDGLFARFDAVEKRAKQARGSGKIVTLAIDEDTNVMEGTGRAALIAAGAVCQAIDLVMDDSNEIRNAFCAVRPPGHHAEPDKAMGFCFFNNIGVGACHLLDRYQDRIQRVLILDFDVHHGNGTQAKFENQYPQGPLRVTVHVEAKTKPIILESRSMKNLVKQCKNKFQLKKSAATIKIYDRHGALVTDDLLSSMPGDEHLYVR